MRKGLPTNKLGFLLGAAKHPILSSDQIHVGDSYPNIKPRKKKDIIF